MVRLLICQRTRPKCQQTRDWIFAKRAACLFPFFACPSDRSGPSSSFSRHRFTNVRLDLSPARDSLPDNLQHAPPNWGRLTASAGGAVTVATRGGRPVTWIGGGGQDPSQLARMGVPELRARFLQVFGQHTASNNSTWLRKKLAEPVACTGPLRAAQPRSRDLHANIWTRGELPAGLPGAKVRAADPPHTHTPRK